MRWGLRVQSPNFPQGSLFEKTCTCGGSAGSGRVLLQGRRKSGDQAELRSGFRAPPPAGPCPRLVPRGCPTGSGSGSLPSRCHPSPGSRPGTAVTGALWSPGRPFHSAPPSSPPFSGFDSTLLCCFQKSDLVPNRGLPPPSCQGPRGASRHPTAAAACLDRGGPTGPAPKASAPRAGALEALPVLPWTALRCVQGVWQARGRGLCAPGRPVPVQVPNHLVPWLSVPLPWKVGSSPL